MLDVIRCGKISSINYESGYAKVTYPDKNNAVTGELPFLSFQYSMPKIGDWVYVAHRSNSLQYGVILGKYWNLNNKPINAGSNIWRKDFDGGFIEHNADNKTLTIKAELIALEGDVVISGSAVISGDLIVKGTLIESGV